MVLSEDIGRGDLFEKVQESFYSRAKVVAKSSGIMAGVEYIKEFENILSLSFEWLKKDGEEFKKQDILFYVEGENIDILKAERSILNILLHAVSVATNTYEFVKRTDGKVKVLDTRKTRPLLREFEKYAVVCGGGTNHRMGLDDCLMLKDTHLKVIKNLKDFIQKARRKIPFTAKIEVECETFLKAKEAMEAGADIIMCDNMDVGEIKKVVELRNSHFPLTMIEASGNIRKENLEKYIWAGVDAVSSGSLIHQAKWLDISMKMEW
jgi:nicotinate-nucleotide pyrophosphorylase (carboxylating)